MPRPKNFVNRDARPQSATEADFEALFVRHTTPQRTDARDISIDRIRPNPFQARRAFEDIDALAQAITAHGFTTRLRVRRDPAEPSFFQLVFGERRLRAANAAGLTVVPCDIAEHTDEDLIEIGLAENIQRQDLDPLEEAQAFQMFIDYRGYSVRRLAERIGKDKGYIENRLALLRTPADVQQMLVQRPDALRAAREIAKLDAPAARKPLIEGLIHGVLNLKNVSAIVREAAAHTDDAATSVIEQVAAHTRQAESPKAAADAAQFDRTLAREMQTLNAIVTRWQATIPTLPVTQRATMIEYLEQQLARLGKLNAQLHNETTHK